MELPELNISNKSRTFGTYLKRDKAIKKIRGVARYRSRYLAHAKRALYHLSYNPVLYFGECLSSFGLCGLQ